MAMFALAAEHAIVLVVLVVAAGAVSCRRYFFTHRRFMALAATNVFMLAFQFEAGFVVIEIPVFP